MFSLLKQLKPKMKIVNFASFLLVNYNWNHFSESISSLVT